MSVFDPLGFLKPFVIQFGILMQEVWVSGIGWDTSLRDDEFMKWKAWVGFLPKINSIYIPRCYLP